jgi:hypothetical protein
MKKILFLFMTIASLAIISSCSSDDDKGNASISGKWYHHSYIYDGATELHDHDCATKKDYIEFNSNNVYKYVIYGTNCTIEDEGTSTWSQKGNIITIFSQEMTITELTQSTLKIYDSEYDETYVFKR